MQEWERESKAKCMSVHEMENGEGGGVEKSSIVCVCVDVYSLSNRAVAKNHFQRCEHTYFSSNISDTLWSILFESTFFSLVRVRS